MTTEIRNDTDKKTRRQHAPHFHTGQTPGVDPVLVADLGAGGRHRMGERRSPRRFARRCERAHGRSQCPDGTAQRPADFGQPDAVGPFLGFQSVRPQSRPGKLGRGGQGILWHDAGGQAGGRPPGAALSQPLRATAEGAGRSRVVGGVPGSVGLVPHGQYPHRGADQQPRGDLRLVGRGRHDIRAAQLRRCLDRPLASDQRDTGQTARIQ